MKGDHLFEDVKLQPINTMFSKLHSHSPHHHPHTHTHPHTLQQQQQQLLHHHHHHQQQQLTRECHNNNTSEEDESRSSGGATGGTGDFGQSSGGGGGGGGGGVVSITKKPRITTEGHSGGSGGGGAVVVGGGGVGDGASIEVSRRPRGRPPGSKNKPKPPIIITRDTECAMRPHILEISSGLDIIDSVARYACQRNVGLCVLTASGTVVNVSLRQPSTTPGATVTFHGRFDILSISVTYLPPSSTNSLPASNGCTISLAGPQGQIFGGSVVGALIAATSVLIVATSFVSPTYHRLPIEDEVVGPNTSDPTQAQVGTPSTAGVDSHSHSTPSESGAMTVYNCSQLPSDVIWTPTARPPPSQHF